MKILVIWNKYASGFVEVLTAAYKKQGLKSVKIVVADSENMLIDLIKPPTGKSQKKKAEPFIPKRIFILVELYWEKQDWYGYTVFGNLILKYNEIFTSIADTTQITFVSVIPQTAIVSKLSKRGDKKSFIASHYQHIEYPTSVDIIQNLPVNSISHYEFLRQLSLFDSSIIDKIEHDVDNLRNENDDAKWASTQRDIRCLSSILTKGLTDRIGTYDINYIINNKEKIKKDIREEYYKSVPVEKQNNYRKSEYKVIIIEDDIKQKQFLKDLLNNFFFNVHFLHVKRELLLCQVLDELKEYDLAFIDLLFEDENGFLPFSGFDIIHTIQTDKEFNHIVFRLFSNMPRHLIGTIINIPVNHIIPKKLTDQTKQQLIELEINTLITECRTKEKSRYYEYGPNIGPFNKYGLKTVLNNEKRSDPGKYYEKYWKKACHFADLFKNGDLTSVTRDWSPELPSPKSIRELDLSEMMNKHLPFIFAHRLIIFYFLLNSNTNSGKKLSFNLELFLDRIQSLVNTNITKYPKAFFNTRLGINCIFKTLDAQSDSFEIKLKNLFPEEIEWLNNNLNNNLDRLTIKENNEEFYNWLIKNNKSSTFPDGIWPSSIDEWTFIDFDKFIVTILKSPKKNKLLIDNLYDSYSAINEDSLPKTVKDSISVLMEFDTELSMVN